MNYDEWFNFKNENFFKVTKNGIITNVKMGNNSGYDPMIKS